jgi:hypothetical protein
MAAPFDENEADPATTILETSGSQYQMTAEFCSGVDVFMAHKFAALAKLQLRDIFRSEILGAIQ